MGILYFSCFSLPCLLTHNTKDFERFREVIKTRWYKNQGAEWVGVQPNTAMRFFRHLRPLIASKLPSYELSGEVEADESYFGNARKGTRGRGAAGKVYTAIIPA